MPFLCASWNVNSLNARKSHVLKWLKLFSPDILLLQELKMEYASFPFDSFRELGYFCAVSGQKAWNGVAVLSRYPMEICGESLPSFSYQDDKQARYIEVVVKDLRIISLYLPNGNPVDSEKFSYKLEWMDRLHTHIEPLLKENIPLIMGGDWNIAPFPGDMHDPSVWAGDALCHSESLKRFRHLLYLGLTDALMAVDSKEGQYTWWDYRGGALEKDQGLRIDHFLLSPSAADRLLCAGIDKRPRLWEKPSDHTVVWCQLS